MMGQGDIQPWEGEPSKAVRLSTGKLAEEANELAGICARIAIQGLDGLDPATGKPNRQALAEEMADVEAAMNFVFKHTGCAPEMDRVQRKSNGYWRWFKMIGLA